MSRALAVSLLLSLLGCAGCSRHEEQSTPAPLPPEASRPSPVDQPAAPPPAAFDWDHRIGIAGRDASGALHVALPSATLGTEDFVTLVWLTDPQTFSEAEIVGRRPKPWVIANAPVEGTDYEVRVGSGTPPSGAYAIAISGVLPKPRMQSGRALIDLDGDGSFETFRSCSSNEGLHLTVWSGMPLEGPQDWHRYIYLGVDLEADCTGQDTGTP